MTRQPLHPPLVHFPIALLGTSLAFDLVGLVRGESMWWAIAFWNVALGLAIGAVAALAGLIDSTRVPADSPASPLVTRHLLVMIGALTCYGAALVVRAGPSAPAGSERVIVLVLEGAGLGLLLLGGYLGGELVYRHGVGKLEPKAMGRSERRPHGTKQSSGA